MGRLCVRIRDRPALRYAVLLDGTPWRYAVVDAATGITVMAGTLADVIYYIAQWERAEPEDVRLEEC